LIAGSWDCGDIGTSRKARMERVDGRCGQFVEFVNTSIRMDNFSISRKPRLFNHGGMQILAWAIWAGGLAWWLMAAVMSHDRDHSFSPQEMTELVSGRYYMAWWALTALTLLPASAFPARALGSLPLGLAADAAFGVLAVAAGLKTRWGQPRSVAELVARWRGRWKFALVAAVAMQVALALAPSP
ncbi:MAG: hypothetical protein ACRETL_04225, partial [Gammaproteobacteria bacterium]